MYDMTQQNPWAEMWTDPAANPLTELWTGEDDPMTMLADPELNPFADAFQFAHEPLTLWTGWVLSGSEGNPFLDTSFGGLNSTGGLEGLPAMDGTMLFDIWSALVESWLTLFDIESSEFTSVPIE